MTARPDVSDPGARIAVWSGPRNISTARRLDTCGGCWMRGQEHLGYFRRRRPSNMLEF
jgi:hypothetical protein